MSECVVYGASDDLIEVEGVICEEFTLKNDGGDGDILAFSSGAALRVVYTNDGIWKITILSPGAGVTIVPADNVDTNYSDRATLVMPDKPDSFGRHWVVRGSEWDWS